MNKQVTSYIEKQKSPQKEMCMKLRKIILKTFPKINESFKLGVPWYEGMFYIVGLRDSVNLGFSVKGLSKADRDNFKGTGKLMRHLKFINLKEIEGKEHEKEIVMLLKLVKKKAKCGSCYG